jgi:PAS domain S-box-containing protein
MKKPKTPADEEARLKSLHALGVLDTEAEERFDRITRLAKNHFDVPIALVSLVDADRQWFKSRQGLGATETHRDISFCGHTILSNQTFVVPDATSHPDFSDNPLVLGDPNIRFYAGAPLRAPDGALVGTLCIIDSRPRNLTDHDLKSLRDLANCAEMELAISAVREREHFLHEIADAMPGLVAYWDKNLICRFANKQYLEWFGRTPAQVLGRNIQSLLGDRLFKLNEPYIRGALGGQPQHFERELTKADGSIGLTWSQYMPDKRGDAVLGFFVLVSDITPLKLAEKELEKAKLEAESANKAKDRFLATVSHEIRTPITAVLGIADLLGSSDLSSEQKEWIQQLRKSSTALLGLINDILDFSKITAGKVEIDATHFSLRDLIKDTCALFSPLGSEKQNAIEVKVTPRLEAAYYGDDKKYRQVLMNLLSNANKFTKNGRISVSVDEVSRKDGLSIIETQVTDTGIGIAPENQNRLFDPFVQEDASTSRKFGGTGLGLSISKKLVELMGGSIKLESVFGRG